MTNTGEGKAAIKNFIYLDEDKMYSLSSQLFEGVTEYVLNESYSGKEDSENQKGPVGSGKILGDILKNSERTTEKKFLNDYSFTIFEKKIIEDERACIVSKGSLSRPPNGKSFIKISSPALFNDINSIKKTLKNFNAVGKALAHVTNFDEISAPRVKPKSNSSQSNRGSGKMATKTSILADVNRLAQQSGLQQDQRFLDDLSLLLNFGFQDQLEVQMNDGDKIYSANLNREFLREPEELIIRKYSRRTEVTFTLFGIVTQHEREGLASLEAIDDNSGIKMALMNLVSSLGNVEATFTGRLENEIIIDPIALYTEL